MTLKRTPIHITKAVDLVMSHTTKQGKENVSLEDSYGRVLCNDVVADMDLPIFNKSAMDGFLIRSEDSRGASGENRLEFKVVDTLPAGDTTDYELKPFEAIRIMTGAMIPHGGDAVVMFETAKMTSEDMFTIRKEFKQHENIALKGEETKRGDVIVEKGTMINPGVIAVLATFGVATVEVYEQPEVAVISTGSELIDVDEELQPGKIRNSNAPMILAQLRRIGIDAKHYQFKMDSLDEIISSIEAVLHKADVIITTGGVSVGDYDLLPQVYEHFNAEVLFNKVAMRPGSVTTVAKVKETLLFGLSGNPSACYSGFELFARPSILKMMGNVNCYAPFIKGVLGEDFKKANPFTRFIRAELMYTESEVVASPSGFNKSNAVTSIAKSNGVIVLPSSSRGYKKGDVVKIMMTDVTSGTKEFLLNEDD